jgi:hypothetical protein
MKSSSSFSRRGPDRVAEELVAVLSSKNSFEFKNLFALVHANLKAKNAASGGEEMLRLRAYEKLQSFVQAGVVKKSGREYKAVAEALASYKAMLEEQSAEMAARKRSRPSAK